MDRFKVLFLPDAAEAWIPAGATLLEAAAAAHVAIDAPCGDRGICGKCKVQVIRQSPLPGPLPEGEGGSCHPEAQSPAPGAQHTAHSAQDSGLRTQDLAHGTQHAALSTQHPSLTAPTLGERTLISAEELAQGWRLACQARVAGHVTVRVPERALKPAVVPLSQVAPRPSVRKLQLRIPEPTIEDPASDLTRIRRALAGEAKSFSMDISPLRQIPSVLAASHDATAVVAGERLIALEPGDTSSRCFGLAVDLGTTSVVVVLADIATGRVLGVESRLNGQANYGADVVSRITRAAEPDGIRNLQTAAVATINAGLASLAEMHGVDPGEVYEAVVVGNSCMNHLFLGIDPRSLALAPYQPVVTEPVSCRASDLGLAIHPEARVYTLPNIAGFVGSDTVGVILATALRQSEQIRLAIDLGTNGEMVLGNRDRLLACSTAAGPAFEGARISCGMRATEGAIERVWIADGEVKLQVIGGGPAIGICGSGLLDAVAQMKGAGLLNDSGRLVPPDPSPVDLPPGLARRLVRSGNSNGFVLARRGSRPIVLTQGDVRELQLAKGAVRAGVSIMMKELGIGEGDIAEVLLAGAFGSYISPASARAIGLVPSLPVERITAVGNAAGQGAIMALVSADFRQEASRIAGFVEYLELSARADFMDEFMAAMALS